MVRKRISTHRFVDNEIDDYALIDTDTLAVLLRDLNLVMPKGNTYGIKVDTDIGSDTFPWRDITSEVLTRGLGATDPDWAVIGATPFSGYKFAINDTCWMSFHIPHDYVFGTDIYLHTHWLPDGTNTASVKWQYVWAYANGHNQAAFDFTGSTEYSEQSPPGTAYQHMVSETPAITVSGMEPDGILYVNITRITNGGTDNTDNIFVLTNDVHYQSTNIGTKNRSPSFYG